MKIKNLHRLLSLAFSLVLIITSVAAAFSVSAEGESITPITDVAEYVWGTNIGNNGDNNFKGQTVIAEYYMNNTLTNVVSNYNTVGDYMAGIMFDSKADNDTTLSKDASDTSGIDDTNNDINQTTSYWKLRFKINGVLNNPESFIFGFHKNNYGFMSQHYAVFASDSYSDIESKKIIEIKSNIRRSADKIDVSGLNLTDIKYVEVWIYHRGYQNMSQHITEIGFFGGTVVPENDIITKNTEIKKKDAANTQIASLGNNHIAAQGYEDSYYFNEADNGGDIVKGTTLANSSLSDGTIGNSAGVGGWCKDECWSKASSNDVFQVETYRAITVNLNEAVNKPEKFLFAFHEGGGMPSKHYAVYMSDSRSTLYDDSNKIIEITDGGQRVADLIDISEKNLNLVTCIGIRIYSFGFMNGNGCKIQHISEIGLYGGTTLSSDEHTTYSTVDSIPTEKINHLKNGTIEAKFYKDGQVTAENTNDISSAVDGIFDDGAIGRWHKPENTCHSTGAANDIVQKENFWQFKVALAGQVDSPKRFTVVFNPDSDGLASQHYAVFAASDEAELFNEENKICEIVDASKRLADSVDLSDKNLTGIKYFGVRFYHRGFIKEDTGCNIQHLSEIGIYGGKLLGDIDGDGNVGSSDLVLLRQKLLGIGNDDTLDFDINKDNEVDIRDLVRLKIISAGI